MKVKKIILVEPSDIILQGLTTILEEVEHFQVVATLHSPENLREKSLSHRPDLLIVNPTLFENGSRSILGSLCKNFPEMRLLALVYQYVPSTSLQFYHSVLDIRESRSRIIMKISELLQNQSTVSAESGLENYELSDRETDVLILVAKGLSSKEIADKLNISVHTVNTHRKNITHKTGIKSVAGLAVYAMLHNLGVGE